MQFSKLKLTGFKSFVDPTELLIEPGMTGIVGPNGCGKSNLVEALRWVMGESSAKQMRGAGMDDVIFNGTSSRPKRNLAEVVLTLENDGRDVGNSVGQPALNDVDIVAVSRRIEREKGSGYKLNGADIRARDVQLLFADHASGARSPALVSQGRVGAIINAKPADRRKILEDAAGVSGLHSRRHEAELRLRAALGNLQRLEDVTGTIETQLNSLLRQARQARRYNSLNEAVRRLDALRLYIHWMNAVAALNAGEAQLRAAETVLAETTRAQSEAQRLRDDAIARLPGLRTKDAEMRAKYRHISDQRDAWQEELTRRDEKRHDAETRAEQIRGDRDRERRILRDMEDALVRLDDEKRELLATTEQAQDVAIGEAVAAAITAAARQVTEGEAALDKTLAEMATLRSRQAEYQRQHDSLMQDKATFDRQEQTLRQKLQSLEATKNTARDAAMAEETAMLVEKGTALANQIGTAEQKRSASRADMEQADQALSHFREGRSAQEQELAAKQQTAEGALQTDIRDSEAKLDTAGDDLRKARAARDKVADDIAALTELLFAAQESDRPVLSSLTVTPGYEQALAVALDKALQAPERAQADAANPYAWRRLGLAVEAAQAPAGTRPLADFVDGNDVLEEALSLVFVLEDGGDPILLQAMLPKGGSLVSRDGGLWRRDGFMIAPGAPSEAAQHLSRQSRLRALEGELPALDQQMTAYQAVLDKAAAALETVKTRLEALRQAQVLEKETLASDLAARDSSLLDRVNTARDQEAVWARQADQLRQQERQATTRLEALRQQQAAAHEKQAETVRQQAALEAELKSVEAAKARHATQLEALPDMQETEEAITALARQQQDLRDQLTAARQQQRDAEAERDQQERDQQARQSRLVDIVQEYDSREGRRREAEQHLTSLDERFNQVAATLDMLQDDPEILARKEADFAQMIETAHADREREAAILAEAESRFIDLDTGLKAAGEALTSAREDRIRAEAGIEQARQHRNQIGVRIAEDLETAPHELWKIADIEAGTKPADLQPVKEVETELDRMKRQRDAIGPVNLRAEVEAEELKTQMGALIEEKADLEQAIDKLKEGIDELNGEGRSRLLKAFEQVDANFGRLFKRLFGGGRAHLTLIESDDPLNAGLEIMASPPGKKLTTLSLLSGGEQALTATALLFGVFLTNPAPICVLDEVDAPLDDANTERFATLIEEIVRLSGTRFLVVTHNPLTMSRMNRLYGVTMTERGVSQMLSVDLERAEELVDDAAA